MTGSMSEIVQNYYNEFMVLYFKHGYSYDEAHKKTMESLNRIFCTHENTVDVGDEDHMDVVCMDCGK